MTFLTSMYSCFLLFFFFKQKTAYEMRISVWSSDVCSSDLRKFKIRDPATTAGDDYAMMREVLTRRFQRALKEDPERSCNQWPDLVLLDGGQGQLTAGSEEIGSASCRERVCQYV